MKAGLLRFALWAAVAIHWLPLPGLLGGVRLRELYGLQAMEPATELLLQHRALLFVLLSLPLLRALLRREPLPWGIGLLMASDLCFAALCALHAPLATELMQVLLIDLLSIALLAAGWFASKPPREKA